MLILLLFYYYLFWEPHTQLCSVIRLRETFEELWIKFNQLYGRQVYYSLYYFSSLCQNYFICIK